MWLAFRCVIYWLLRTHLVRNALAHIIEFLSEVVAYEIIFFFALPVRMQSRPKKKKGRNRRVQFLPTLWEGGAAVKPVNRCEKIYYKSVCFISLTFSVGIERKKEQNKWLSTTSTTEAAHRLSFQPATPLERNKNYMKYDPHTHTRDKFFFLPIFLFLIRYQRKMLSQIQNIKK